jgi:hypothetical protein
LRSILRRQTHRKGSARAYGVIPFEAAERRRTGSTMVRERLSARL